MDKYVVQQYQENDYDNWNAFIGQAKNATFLFHRDFMEYHKDRFDDFSLMIFDKQNLVAVLPANRIGNAVYSHQGLTYGGLVFKAKTIGENIGFIMEMLLSFLKENSVTTLYYKPIPSFYCLSGNSEADFFLFKKGAILERKEMNLASNLALPLTISKSKLKHFNKINGFDLEIVEEQQLDAFWKNVLEPRLWNKFGVKPVHSVEEITTLKDNFPSNIKQFSVYYENSIISGITVFETDTVVKSQYGATTEIGEKLRALDYLFITLLSKYKKEGKLFFDMGIVNEDNDLGYHAGLLKQKEELGCAVFSQDFYKLTIL
ncbi:FemAB family protein [Flavobacterium muglaense]|uniref:FemAB family protein n=1 Tax=Flavobacterium muglaense TaxID=2764716 RepID=A0A923N2T9_9FLAO|nr:FemAB family protein [Flavobacterium muglaense]MBC5839141.1 FemAB family protein [Flavobacterium muglaense]MBC5845599.1 FemAB family protein [Flavobacterium muglaense]